MPLEGGVILDMTRMKAVKRLEPGMARVEAGLKQVWTPNGNLPDHLGRNTG